MKETLGKRAFTSTLKRVAGGHSGGFAAKRNAFGPQRMTNEAIREPVVRDAREVKTLNGDGATGIQHFEDAVRFLARNWCAFTHLVCHLTPRAPIGRRARRPRNKRPWRPIEVHPCAVDDALESIGHESPVLTAADCGPLANLGPAESAELARAAGQAGAPLIIYDFAAFQPNPSTIEALGAEI